MTCQNCGQPVENNEICDKCENEVAITIEKSKPTIEQSIALESDHDVLTFVHKNKEFYIKKWKRLAEGKNSWNFAAFFLTFFWLGYRKMYKYVFIISLIFLAIDAVYYLFLHSPGTEKLFDSLNNSIGLGLGIYLGLNGNALYKKHAEKQVQEIKDQAQDDAEKNDLLKKKGGRSFLGVIIAALIFLGVYVIPAATIFWE